MSKIDLIQTDAAQSNAVRFVTQINEAISAAEAFQKAFEQRNDEKTDYYRQQKKTFLTALTLATDRIENAVGQINHYSHLEGHDGTAKLIPPFSEDEIRKIIVFHELIEKIHTHMKVVAGFEIPGVVKSFHVLDRFRQRFYVDQAAKKDPNNHKREGKTEKQGIGGHLENMKRKVKAFFTAGKDKGRERERI